MAATTIRLGLPYPVPNDTVDVPRDVQALATKLDGLSALQPPIVTALPGSPVDGQEILLRAGTFPASVLWRLRYDASIGDASKWMFIGGPPLFSTHVIGGAGDVSTATVNNYTVWTLGPEITVPVSGNYVLESEPIWTEQQTAPTSVCRLLFFTDTFQATNDPAIHLGTTAGIGSTLRPRGAAALIAGQKVHLAFATNNTPFRIGGYGAMFDMTPSRLG